MKHTGNITLHVDGLAIRKLRYESKDERDTILKEWRKYTLGEVSYVIAPDEHVPETIAELPLITWDFKPYEPPKFQEEEWTRPAPVYSNKGYQHILDTYL